MFHFDTLHQRNARTHISHIALLVDINNLIIRNGSSTFLCTPSWIVSHSQTTIFSFVLGQEKIGSGTLATQFLFRFPRTCQFRVGDDC